MPTGVIVKAFVKHSSNFPADPERRLLASLALVKVASIIWEDALPPGSPLLRRPPPGPRSRCCVNVAVVQGVGPGGRGDIVEHPVRVGQGRQPGAIGVGSDRQLLERQRGFVGFFGM